MSAPRGRRDGGRALVSCLGALALIGLLAAGPAAVRPLAGRATAAGAARALAARMREQQRVAVTQGYSAGLVFPSEGRDEPLRPVVDGDGDGIHRDDVRSGTDPSGPAFTLAREHPGARVAPPPWPDVPDVPPRPGCIGPESRAVRLGTGRAAVFTPSGRARSGSVLVVGAGEGLCAVVVHGATGRVRVSCLDRQAGVWRPPRY